MLWLFGMMVMINMSFAQVGHVLKMVGGSDAYALREGAKIILAPEIELMEQDEVHAEQSHIVIQLYPSTQMSLPVGSVIKITKNVIEEGEKLTKSKSIINLIKGYIRLQVTKVEEVEIEQEVEAQNVSFGVRGTEFEVSLEDENVDLDVFEGEVEVTSPEVMTFVPYFVKRDEGFRFTRKKPAFNKRKLARRMKETGFISRAQIKERWKERRARKKMLKGRRSMKRFERKKRNK